MTILSCGRCGGSVHAAAPACPRCGLPGSAVNAPDDDATELRRLLSPPWYERISPAAWVLGITLGCAGTVALGLACAPQREAVNARHVVSSQEPRGPAASPEPEPYSASTIAPLESEAAEDIRVFRNNVYWRTDDFDTERGSIRRISTSGTGSPETLVSNQKNIVTFAVGDDRLYWSTDDDHHRGIFTKSTSGGSERRFQPLEAWADSIAVLGDNVFWLATGDLYMKPARGDFAPHRVFAHGAGAGGWANHLTAAGGELYWVLDGKLVSIRSDGSGFRQVATGFTHVHSIAVDAKAVYVVNGEEKSGSVLRIDRQTGATTTLLAGRPHPWGVTVDGGYAFVISSGKHGSVTRVSTGGEGAVEIASDISYGKGIAAVNGTLFWTTTSPGSVVRASTSPLATR